MSVLVGQNHVEWRIANLYNLFVSTLDNLTDRAVMEAVNNLSHEIIIAHGLSAVRKCDQMYLFSKGRMLTHGTYDKLVKEKEIFRAIVAK